MPYSDCVCTRGDRCFEYSIIVIIIYSLICGSIDSPPVYDELAALCNEMSRTSVLAVGLIHYHLETETRRTLDEFPKLGLHFRKLSHCWTDTGSRSMRFRLWRSRVRGSWGFPKLRGHPVSKGWLDLAYCLRQEIGVNENEQNENGYMIIDIWEFIYESRWNGNKMKIPYVRYTVVMKRWMDVLNRSLWRIEWDDSK